MSGSEYRRIRASLSPPSSACGAPTRSTAAAERESTDDVDDRRAPTDRRFGNPHEEKKEEERSSTARPLTPPSPPPIGSRGRHDQQPSKGSSTALLLSPAPTATTVVTSTSSPLEPENDDDDDNEGGTRRRRGPLNVRYTYLSDAVPCANLSPASTTTAGTSSQRGDGAASSTLAVEQSSSALAATALTATLPALPIPLPPPSSLTPHLRYYRVVYRGVVALLKSPNRQSPRSGAYLSYGEVFATAVILDDDEVEEDISASNSSDDIESARSGAPRPRRNSSLDRGTTTTKLPPPRLPLLPINKHRDTDRHEASVLRVDYVLTGGYANESNEPNLTEASSDQRLGYLFAQSANGEAIVERINSPSSELPPAVSAGPWTYKIVSAAPVPTITGPCADAPRTAAMLLPGSIHDVSLCFDGQYLRLHHRRGWFRLYREAPGENGAAVARVPTAQLVQIDEAVAAADPDGHGNAADLSMTSHSTSSSYSTTNASFNTSFVSAASTQRHLDRRRHRPPRRTLEQERGDALGPSLFPRHVTGAAGGSRSTGSAGTLSPGKRHHPHHQQQHQQLDERCSVSLVSDDEGESSEQSLRSNDEPVYLMRVLHPKGLKILDAPQYAASHLIHGSLAAHPQQQRYASSAASSSSAVPHRVFSTLPPMRSNPVIVFDSHSKTRRLPTGVYFEARSLLQQTMVNGEGLVQLFDKTGWAMVPTPADVEMVAQASLSNGREWVRVMARTGLAVTNPPLPPPASGSVSAPQSPNSIRTATTSAAESTSDVASSVGSAILDVFRTPKKKPQAQSVILPSPESTVIPCGTVVHVERVVSGDFARLLGGQGWIPMALQGRPVCVRLSPAAAPEFRRGSFWFRVQSPRGIRVRIGPSRRAPSIKSAASSPDKDQRSTYFRFECGEFLRASEIVTLFAHTDGESSTSVAECHCKLYRNRHVNLHPPQSSFESVVPLEAYTSPSEWVQVYHGEDLFLEECAQEPHIERHKTGGWKYQVLREVSVRKGPSFASETTGTLEPGDSITVNERVAPPSGYADDRAVPDDKSLHWLRLKDGLGWVHDTCQDTGEALVVPNSLRHHNNKPKKKVVGKTDEVAYNAIIARLFHPRDDADSPGTSLRPSHSR